MQKSLRFPVIADNSYIVRYTHTIGSQSVYQTQRHRITCTYDAVRLFDLSAGNLSAKLIGLFLPEFAVKDTVLIKCDTIVRKPLLKSGKPFLRNIIILET